MEPNRTAILAEVDHLLHQPILTKETSSRCEQLLALADSLVDRSALRRETLNQHAAEMGRPPYEPGGPNARFSAYLRQGKSVLSPEERVAVGGENTRSIRAAQAEGTGSAGGYIATPSFSDRLEVYLQATDPIFRLARVWESESGTPSNYPSLNDVGNSAVVVAENGPSTEAEPTYAAVSFGQTPTYRVGPLQASVELVQDSHFPLEEVLSAAAGVRFARGIGAAMTSTLLSQAQAGPTTASASAIAGVEIHALVESVDPAYSSNGSFLMSLSTYLAVCKLAGSSGNYLFPARRDADGDRELLGFKVFISPSLPSIAAGAQVATFGDHGRFLRRQVRGSLMFKVLVQKFAFAGQVGFLGFWRVDGQLATSLAVSVLTMHS